MDQKAVKEAIEALGHDWQEFKSANDALLKAKADGESVAELESKVDRINSAITDAEARKAAAEADRKSLIERIDQLEASLQNHKPGSAVDQAKAKHRQLFDAFLRSKSNSSVAARELGAFENTPEGKAISTAAGVTGGYAVPEEISRMINEQETLLSPMRNLVKVVQAGTPDYKELVAVHNTHGGGWVGETDTRTETGTAGLRERAPTFGMLYAYPKATEESLDDMFFNVGQFLVDHTSLTFSQLEGIAHPDRQTAPKSRRAS
jgi:HK97 family phage major capsid protein